MTNDTRDSWFAFRLLVIYLALVSSMMCAASGCVEVPKHAQTPKIDHKDAAPTDAGAGQTKPKKDPRYVVHVQPTCPPGVGWVADLCADADSTGGHLYCPGVHKECSIILWWCPKGLTRDFDGCRPALYTCVENCVLHPDTKIHQAKRDVY